MEFAGKTFFITGASRGIGAATAEYVVQNGGNAVLVARSSAVISDIATTLGDRAMAIAVDVADQASVADAIDQTIAKFGALDVVVNNAGTLEPIGALADIAPDAWDKVIDVNVKGVFYAMHKAIPIMVAQGGGTIINISSGAAYGVLVGWSHYCASKAAVLQLTRSGDKEYGAKGVRVIGLSPGTVATEMQVAIKASGINPVSQLEVSDHIPPSDVAQTIGYLVGAGGDQYLGSDFKLSAPGSRQEIGLA